MPVKHVITVDVGNTTTHFGWCAVSGGHPTIVSTCSVRSTGEPADQIGGKQRHGEQSDRHRLQQWLNDVTESEAAVASTSIPCYIGSVFLRASDRTTSWLSENYPKLSVHQIRSTDVPIDSSVEDIASVGVDRLAAAVSANVLRKPSHGAIVVDSGTAVTVDGVDSSGQFLGGAIAPGWHMSAESLHRVADQLPLVAPVDIAPPPIGKNTEQAIRSGLYWGSIGTVRELVIQLRRHINCECETFVAGRGAEMLASHLSNATVCPALVLIGIALAGEASRN